MKIYFIRHGITYSNEQGILQGHLNIPLSDNGLKQAHALGKALQNKNIEHIYSSDLLRADQTASILGEYCFPQFDRNVHITFSHLLRERRMGKYEGQPTEKLFEDAKAAGMSVHEYTESMNIPDFDTSTDMITHFKKFQKDFLEDHNDHKKYQTIAIVSHGSYLRNILGSFEGITMEDFVEKYGKLKNTSVSIYNYDHDIWNKEILGDISHLE